MFAQLGEEPELAQHASIFFCLAIEGFWQTAARRANGLKNVTSLNRQMDLTADVADNADVSGIRAIRVIRAYFFSSN